MARYRVSITLEFDDDSPERAENRIHRLQSIGNKRNNFEWGYADIPEQRTSCGHAGEVWEPVMDWPAGGYEPFYWEAFR